MQSKERQRDRKSKETGKCTNVTNHRSHVGLSTLFFKIYAKKFWNTISDAFTQISLFPIFLKRGDSCTQAMTMSTEMMVITSQLTCITQVNFTHMMHTSKLLTLRSVHCWCHFTTKNQVFLITPHFCRLVPLWTLNDHPESTPSDKS